MVRAGTGGAGHGWVVGGVNGGTVPAVIVVVVVPAPAPVERVVLVDAGDPVGRAPPTSADVVDVEAPASSVVLAVVSPGVPPSGISPTAGPAGSPPRLPARTATEGRPPF